MKPTATEQCSVNMFKTLYAISQHLHLHPTPARKLYTLEMILARPGMGGPWRNCHPSRAGSYRVRPAAYLQAWILMVEDRCPSLLLELL